MTAATINGSQPRKQLSDQIDRLDHMLDGLSEAIPSVVADAVRQAVHEGVREGVQAAVSELLANQQVLNVLQGQQQTTAAAPLPSSSCSATPQPSVPPQPAAPSFLSRANKAVWQGVSWVGKQFGRVGNMVGRSIRAVGQASVACARYGAYPIVSAALAVVELAFGVRRGWSFSVA
jgi:hypothetical protein